jgi:hypothetical protein
MRGYVQLEHILRSAEATTEGGSQEEERDG